MNGIVALLTFFSCCLCLVTEAAPTDGCALKDPTSVIGDIFEDIDKTVAKKDHKGASSVIKCLHELPACTCSLIIILQWISALAGCT